MCKKLTVLLLVVGLSVPALADYIGWPSPCENPLAVSYTLDDQKAICPYQPWPVSWDWTGPINKTFNNPYAVDPWEIPVGSLEAYRMGQTPPADAQGGGRNRGGGMAYVAGTGEYNATSKGLGTSYLKLTVTGLCPETSYKVVVWSYEATGVWSMRTDNPQSKFGVWSTVNPMDWLTNNGYPIGYGPKFSIDNPVATTDTNMPAGLQAVALGPNNGKRFSLMSDGVINDGNDHLGTNLNCARICDVDTNPDGVLVLYGWIDSTDWAGSMHMPINGFLIVPEPMTVALLGLGGLALIRRKKRA